MTKENKDLKKEEAKTSTEESTVEEKPDKNIEENEELTAAKKKAEDQERRAIKAEEDKRKVEAKLEAKGNTETQDDIPDWQKEKQSEREERFLLAQKNIAKKFPFLQSENDLDGTNWTKFKEACDKYGGPQSLTQEGIELEYEGFIRMALPEMVAEKNQTLDPVVEDSGVGDVSSSPKSTEKTQSALTRPLNAEEKKAASFFPSGEEGYRKKLAEREESRQGNLTSK